ncbi:integral membrane protein 2C [Chrysoperla carnea]|uniref:integral membrane protein 2C n=1 Tax=Chrysoperla carnea TaxID=189513 RepID=UPI001D073F96|nr:integral membrane protein 2C [Chrysoperla carnea]XP_044742574.1 integral membrane protein 2C [Chrysoperla carnea]
MTIITKPITEKKIDKNGALLENAENIGIIPPVGAGDGDLESQQSIDEPQFVILRARARRVSSATTLCLFLTALIVMTFGIIGGTYLYRQYVRAQMHRFRGWCNIPLDSTKSQQYLHQTMLSDSNLFPSNDQYDNEMNRILDQDDFLREDFEIDLDDEHYEKIDVPDFQGGRKGRFIHDFYANKTGIIDIDKKRCFVMPLNRGMVLPPRSLFDLIQKMWDGYYEVDTERVRETMKVVTPPLTDLKDVGSYIKNECKNMTVYQLEKYNSTVMKRSVSDGQTYVMFAGKKTVELDIIDFDDF